MAFDEHGSDAESVRRRRMDAIYWGIVLVWAGLVFFADSQGLLPQIGTASAWSWIFVGAGLVALAGTLWRAVSESWPSPSIWDYVWAAILLIVGLAGFLGMGLSGLSKGKINISGPAKRPYERVPSLAEYYKGRLTPEEVERIRKKATAAGTSMHDALMEAAGWPEIPYDGKLLISHQDALLLGGKVQAPPGYPDHVVFLYPSVCEACETKLCIEICSGEAITPGEGGVPQFDREKCIHCGACFWSCTQPREDDPERTVLEFRAGAGGLHSAEN